MAPASFIGSSFIRSSPREKRCGFCTYLNYYIHVQRDTGWLGVVYRVRTILVLRYWVLGDPIFADVLHWIVLLLGDIIFRCYMVQYDTDHTAVITVRDNHCLCMYSFRLPTDGCP